MHTFRQGKHFRRFRVSFLFLNIFCCKQLFVFTVSRKVPPLLLLLITLLLTAQLELACNDAILTSSGSARGGYMDVRSVARHKQHATEQLFTKSYTNILKQILFGLQRHDPHLRRLRQRGVLGSAFRRATQAACDGTAF